MGGLSRQIPSYELEPRARPPTDGAEIMGEYVDEAFFDAAGSAALLLDAVFHVLLFQKKPHPNTLQPRFPLAQ